MASNERALNYDHAEQDIDFIQEQFKLLIDDENLCGILGDDIAVRMNEWDSLITKRRTEPFSLVVLGDFKRGKSTIINALLGKNLAPVNVAPETLTINSISYGDEPGVTAVLYNGKRIPLKNDELARDRLEYLMQRLPDKIDYVDIRDNSALLKEIRIVDTPGLSDLDDLDKQVQNYLVNADAVIYVASALLPFSETEQMFLATHIQPQKFSRLYVLINMIDALSSKEDISKVVNRVVDRCESIIPNAYIYGVSGSDEFKRKTGAERPDTKGLQEYYELEFFKFEISLKRDIIVQKDVIRTERVLTMLNLMVKDMTARIKMISEMTALDRKNLDDLSLGLEIECATLANALEAKKPSLILSVVEMQQEAERWMYEFFAKFREDIVACRTTAAAQDLDKYFYSYLMDKVGEAYRKCIEIHQARVNDIISKLSSQLSDKLGISNLTAASQSASVGDLMNEVNKQVAEQVINAASAGNGEGFPNTTMSSFTNILKKKRTTDIIDIALENYDDIRNYTVKDLKVAYKALEDNAVRRFDSIYQRQVDVGMEAVSQTMEMLGSYDHDLIEKTLLNAEDILSKIDDRLKSYNIL